MFKGGFITGGTEYIQSKIAEAVENETRTARISGKRIIESAVRIPSNFTLILEDCHLIMADGVYSNMFVNEHHDTDEGRTVAGTDYNISIIGRGMAILDGGEYNGLHERNAGKDGLPPIFLNNLILFTNVEGFKISNLSLINQRWWAINCIYCRSGQISDLYVCSTDTAVNPDGSFRDGLTREKYSNIYVKNSDGVDLRQGCHDITIENISGFTEDDTVALTALDGRMEQRFKVEGLPSDICNIVVRNISSSAFCSNVRLLNQGEIKLHDILIDGVYDTSADSLHMDRGGHAIRVGDLHLYGKRHSTKDETYNITIRNVRSRAVSALALAGEIKNLSFYNIECFDGCKMIEDNRTWSEADEK